MGESETALLRREMAKMMVEIKRLQDTVARVEAERDRIRIGLEEQIDLLMETIAEQDRRLAKYENPNAPSYTDSMYNAERDAFRKRLAEEEGRGGACGSRGAPAWRATSSRLDEFTRGQDRARILCKMRPPRRGPSQIVRILASGLKSESKVRRARTFKGLARTPIPPRLISDSSPHASCFPTDAP